jgi:hypothetical protein
MVLPTKEKTMGLITFTTIVKRADALAVEDEIFLRPADRVHILA